MQIYKRLRPLLVLLWIRTVIGAVILKPQQRFANQPSPQTAVIGSTVVLPCRIINMVGELQWTRDGFGLGNERQLYAFKRYTMIGSNEEGDYSLRISPVTLEDDAEFQCQVTGWKDIPGVRSQTAKLSVYVHPERPKILQGPAVKATAGESVKLECVSKGGKPAAEIQWLDSSGRVVTEGVHYTNMLLKDSHRFDAKSVLNFVASREHHNTQFTCTATNPALHQPYKKQVRLEVTYPPVVSLQYDKHSGYKEGESAILTCSATANPSNLSFRWYRAGKLVSNVNETSLRISKLNKESNTEDITCEVSNRIGKSRKSTRLNVRYGPVFHSEPTDVYAEDGEDVTLMCQVDGSPKPKIVWIPLNNSSFIFGKGESLTLRAGADTVGKYLCLAKVEDFPDISATVGLFLKAPPKVEAERVQWGQIGDTALLQCFVPAATPKSTSVTWAYRGREIELANRRYEIQKEITSEGLFVRLLVKVTKLEDFDAYSCSVHNNFGSDQIHIVLKRKKTIPLTIVLAGVAGGIIFILVVAILAIVYGKRTTVKSQEIKKSGFSEKSIHITDQNSTGNDSDLKVEIDNRTGSSMSTKEPEVEQSWDKRGNEDDTQNYLAGVVSATYLYPETYGNIPLKANGHVGNTVNNITYSDYQERLANPVLSPISQHTLSGGYPVSGSFSPRTQPPLHTSSQLNIYPYHEDYGGNIPQDSVEGLRGLSSTLNNTLCPQIYKNGNSALHLSLSRPSCATGHGINSSLHPSATNSIPRLGIPVDSSQYIMPPRTQVLQGALATHV